MGKGFFDVIYNKIRLVSDLGEDVANQLFIGLLDTLFYSMFPGDVSLQQPFSSLMAINDIWHYFTLTSHVQLKTDWRFDCAFTKMVSGNADSFIQIF